MPKREMFKDVEVGGRKWRINRFDALTGSYIATLLLLQILPMGMGGQVGSDSPSNKGKSLMDKDTFRDLQMECLKIVSEIKLVGSVEAPVPLMLPDGRWGVEDVDTDTSTILSLMVNALIFNVSDFFQEAALKDLTGTLQGLSQFNATE
jgi:hypothetical protein